MSDQSQIFQEARDQIEALKKNLEDTGKAADLLAKSKAAVQTGAKSLQSLGDQMGAMCNGFQALADNLGRLAPEPIVRELEKHAQGQADLKRLLEGQARSQGDLSQLLKKISEETAQNLGRLENLLAEVTQSQEQQTRQIRNLLATLEKSVERMLADSTKELKDSRLQGEKKLDSLAQNLKGLEQRIQAIQAEVEVSRKEVQKSFWTKLFG